MYTLIWILSFELQTAKLLMTSVTEGEMRICTSEYADSSSLYSWGFREKLGRQLKLTNTTFWHCTKQPYKAAKSILLKRDRLKALKACWELIWIKIHRIPLFITLQGLQTAMVIRLSLHEFLHSYQLFPFINYWSSIWSNDILLNYKLWQNGN